MKGGRSQLSGGDIHERGASHSYLVGTFMKGGKSQLSGGDIHERGQVTAIWWGHS